jgi:hypothetical protein
MRVTDKTAMVLSVIDIDTGSSPAANGWLGWVERIEEEL